jgi:hypothetical protein
VSKRHPQEWIAAAVLTVVLALIVLDVVDHAFNTWFDRHSFATDAVSTLLGLAVAGLVVDRISARRRLRDRAQVMAAQGAMIAAQALRATQAVTSALDGSGDRDSAADELRTFMTMMLTAAPALMDAPQTREFLETSQHHGDLHAHRPLESSQPLPPHLPHRPRRRDRADGRADMPRADAGEAGPLTMTS